MGYVVDSSAEPPAANLVDEVKTLQRGDPAAREQWSLYTTVNGQGLKDPAKHTSEFLEGFLQAWNSGNRLDGSTVSLKPDRGSQPAVDMAPTIKALQGKSPAFKQFWANYCIQNGSGRQDPNKHEAEYHVAFFDALASQALSHMPGAGMGMVGGPPQKRMRTDSGMGMHHQGGYGGGMGMHHQGAYGGGMGGGGPGAYGGGQGAYGGGMGGGGMGMHHQSSGDPQKDSLVAAVKAFQRMGVQQKELWAKYADMFLHGVRDPSRHESDTLHEFCVNHNVPMDSPAGGGGYGGKGGYDGGCGGYGGKGGYDGGNGGYGGGKGSPYGGPRLNPQGAVVNDPVREGLVQRIKTFQRISKENSEMWKTFAGNFHDPNRHEIPKLQEFIQSYGVP